MRFKLAIGIAEALSYLHDEYPRPVVHRDVKSSNILLTDELEPQVVLESPHRIDVDSFSSIRNPN